MSKIQTFVVSIEFADKISSDDDIKQIGTNVANAIKNEAACMGIAPEDSDTYTVNVTVSQSGLILAEMSVIE